MDNWKDYIKEVEVVLISYSGWCRLKEKEMYESLGILKAELADRPIEAREQTKRIAHAVHAILEKLQVISDGAYDAAHHIVDGFRDVETDEEEKEVNK